MVVGWYNVLRCCHYPPCSATYFDSWCPSYSWHIALWWLFESTVQYNAFWWLLVTWCPSDMQMIYVTYFDNCWLMQRTLMVFVSTMQYNVLRWFLVSLVHEMIYITYFDGCWLIQRILMVVCIHRRVQRT